MSGSTNIKPFNEALANIETDATYAADAMRTGGITAGVLPSAMLNKVLLQTANVISALAQALAAKGYVIEDGSAGTAGHDLNALITVLANIMTAADTGGKNDPDGYAGVDEDGFLHIGLQRDLRTFVQGILTHDIATGSGVFVAMHADLTITVAVGASGKVMLSANLQYEGTNGDTNPTSAKFRINRDAGEEFISLGRGENSGGAHSSIGRSILFTGLTPGNHTFSLEWHRFYGTSNVVCQPSSSPDEFFANIISETW